jgi:hypothetical protein
MSVRGAVGAITVNISEIPGIGAQFWGGTLGGEPGSNGTAMSIGT